MWCLEPRFSKSPPAYFQGSRPESRSCFWCLCSVSPDWFPVCSQLFPATLSLWAGKSADRGIDVQSFLAVEVRGQEFAYHGNNPAKAGQGTVLSCFHPSFPGVGGRWRVGRWALGAGPHCPRGKLSTSRSRSIYSKIFNSMALP